MAITEKYVSSLASGGTGSWANPWDLSTALTSAVAGDRLNILDDGTYTVNSQILASNQGSLTSPIIMRGRTSSDTSAYGSRTNAGPLDTSKMPTIQLNGNQYIYLNYYWWVESINFTGSGSIFINQFSIIKNCVGDIDGSAYNQYIDCDSPNIGLGGGFGSINGCRISTGSTGIRAWQGIINNCIVFDIGNAVDSGSLFMRIMNCTLVNPTNNGMEFLSANSFISISACNIITGTGQRAHVALSGTYPLATMKERTRDNTLTDSGMTDWKQDWKSITTDTGGDEQDYIKASTNDYRLVYTSPATAKGAFDWNDIGALKAT